MEYITIFLDIDHTKPEDQVVPFTPKKTVKEDILVPNNEFNNIIRIHKNGAPLGVHSN